MEAAQHSGSPANYRTKTPRAGDIRGQRGSGNFAHDRESAAEAGRETDDQPDGSALVREVRAIFASPDQMQDAVSRLSVCGCFDDADMSLPSCGRVEGLESAEAAVKPALTERDAGQARTLAASTAATTTALAAADDLVLAVRTTTEAKRSQAEAILFTAGATGIERVPAKRLYFSVSN